MQAIRLTSFCKALVATLILLFASPFPTLASQTPYVESLSILEDPTKSLTIDDIVSGKEDGRFKESQLLFHTNNSEQAYWLRFTIKYPQNSTNESWVLDLSWDFLRSLDCYFPSQRNAEPYVNGNFNLSIDSSIKLPPHQIGDQLVIFVRLTCYAGINLNPLIKSAPADAVNSALRKRLLDMLFGLMIAMIVYNLFLFISLRA